MSNHKKRGKRRQGNKCKANDVELKTSCLNKDKLNQLCESELDGRGVGRRLPKAFAADNENVEGNAATSANPSFMALSAAAAGVVSSILIGLGGGDATESESDSTKICYEDQARRHFVDKKRN